MKCTDEDKPSSCFSPSLQIQQLTETLDSVSNEKERLLAERTSHSCQLKEQMSSTTEEKDELQKLLQDTRSERDQLKMELQKSSEMVGVANCIPKIGIIYLLEWYLKYACIYFSILKRVLNWNVL